MLSILRYYFHTLLSFNISHPRGQHPPVKYKFELHFVHFITCDSFTNFTNCFYRTIRTNSVPLAYTVRVSSYARLFSTSNLDTSKLNNWTSNLKLRNWIEEQTKLFQPDKLHLCDGSEQEYNKYCVGGFSIGSNKITDLQMN